MGVREIADAQRDLYDMLIDRETVVGVCLQGVPCCVVGGKCWREKEVHHANSKTRRARKVLNHLHVTKVHSHSQPSRWSPLLLCYFALGIKPDVKTLGHPRLLQQERWINKCSCSFRMAGTQSLWNTILGKSTQ